MKLYLEGWDYEKREKERTESAQIAVIAVGMQASHFKQPPKDGGRGKEWRSKVKIGLQK